MSCVFKSSEVDLVLATDGFMDWLFKSQVRYIVNLVLTKNDLDYFFLSTMASAVISLKYCEILQHYTVSSAGPRGFLTEREMQGLNPGLLTRQHDDVLPSSIIFLTLKIHFLLRVILRSCGYFPRLFQKLFNPSPPPPPTLTHFWLTSISTAHVHFWNLQRAAYILNPNM